VRGAGKVGDFKQAAVLVAKRRARGVDNGHVVFRRTERVPFQPLAGDFLLGGLVVGEDEQVRLLLAEFGRKRDRSINRRVRRPAFPLRQ